MFKPELKNTGWAEVEEPVFEITGENYQDLNFISNSIYSVYYTDIEQDLANTINKELMDVIWEPTIISELEDRFAEKLNDTWIDILSFRLEFEGDSQYSREPCIEECIYGWVHYKVNKRIKTFRFKIDLKGEFTKC